MEDFVIVSDEFYESDPVSHEKTSDSGDKSLKIENKDDDSEFQLRNHSGSEKEHDGNLDIHKSDEWRVNFRTDSYLF